jgi:hypothetical protein
MAWELSYIIKKNNKVIVYENRAVHHDYKCLEKFGTLQKNDAGHYYFKKAFFVVGILDTQLEGLTKIINELEHKNINEIKHINVE